ncbi:MAG: hypothetical protein JXQ72_04820 [Anaerolineae bacterium]|nr:hypothetical protein [Anaerolineae bacterium]
MGPELIVLALGTLGLGGIGGWWVTQQARRDHVNRARTDWVRAGQIIRYGPVSAVCYGQRPRRVYRGGMFGALGIAGGQVVFDGLRASRCDLHLAPDTIRWIGLSTIPVLAGRAISRRRVLSIHTDGPDGWRVIVFALDEPLAFAEQVAGITDLPVRDSGGTREDYGPVTAMRLDQDVYGEWSPDREDALYLAPDRLLFGWRDAIPLDDVRRIDTLHQRGGGPFSQDILRVEYVISGEFEEEFAVVGFGVRGANQWAAAIQRRIDAPVPVQAGRKKKS